MARNGVQYAQTAVKRVPMYDATCAAKVIEHISTFYPQPFDAAALVEAQCGRFTRGAHKGQLRGWATITVVAEGGWKKNGPGYGNGRVVYPGTVLSISIEDFNGKPYLQVGV